MATMKPNPDHYTVRPPPAPTIEPQIYAEKQEQLAREPASEAPPQEHPVPDELHAGDRVSRSVKAMCKGCGAKIGLRAKAVLEACSNCGGESFEVLA